ncbi:tetratricopeptide repeat protein [Hwanghaeella grinnelliae]|uniref:Tetratricopeptide repeat protein n=1 Tax=Hwanghaeella grinnelliae TaxID=2500179 RepID=A0A3S2VNU2_9PROT|nr:tetratricopeptide repeat protein [Hwanghaeella grinnelliae]RVU35002.1 tetratricopeptide repeat protein [Hwanghaeella grinnelliae]
MALNRQQRRANAKGKQQHSNPQIQAVLNAALAHQQKGEYADSERMIRRVLEASPGNPDALHLRGALAYQTGNIQLALDSLTEAAARAPKAGNILATLALAQDAAGLKDVAERTYRKAQRLEPRNAEIRNNLGALLKSQGNVKEAVRQFRDALKIDPNYTQAVINLGGTLFRQGEAEEAEGLFRRALVLEPENPDVATDLAVILQHNKKTEEAEGLFTSALAAQPDNVPALINLASLHFQNANYVEGEAIAREAVRLMPGHHAAHNNLGNNLLGQHKYAEAEAAFLKARSLLPNGSEAAGNLGHLKLRTGQPDEAEGLYRQALDVAKDNPRHRFGLSLALFAQAAAKGGDLTEAWDHYEAGFDCGERNPDRRRSAKPWNGEPLAEKTLLLWPEQGIGDEIRFSESLPDFLDALDDGPLAGGKVFIECDPRLVPAFSRSFEANDQISVAPAMSTAISGIDFQLSLGQVAARMRPTVGAFPSRPGFLAANDGLRQKWRQRLDALGRKPKIGISWRSGLKTARRAENVSDLEQWYDFLDTIPADFIALQYGEIDAELRQLEQATYIKLHRWDDMDLRDDVDDLLAMMCELDFVVTVPTSLMDMAGSVGARTITAMLENEWVLLGTERHPWYPSVQVATRALEENWRAPLAQASASLRDSLNN